MEILLVHTLINFISLLNWASQKSLHIKYIFTDSVLYVQKVLSLCRSIHFGLTYTFLASRYKKKLKRPFGHTVRCNEEIRAHLTSKNKSLFRFLELDF